MSGRSEEREVAEAAVTAELLAKYDRPGPRYTSYPTYGYACYGPLYRRG